MYEILCTLPMRGGGLRSGKPKKWNVDVRRKLGDKEIARTHKTCTSCTIGAQATTAAAEAAAPARSKIMSIYILLSFDVQTF